MGFEPSNVKLRFEIRTYAIKEDFLGMFIFLGFEPQIYSYRQTFPSTVLKTSCSKPNFNDLQA